MKRFFNLVLGALAMLAVALVSAFLTMRLAIHGREVKVPVLTGLSLSDASKKASSTGLRLNLENRFYSADVEPGKVLAQSPAAGATVRREWAVRVTESLGPQQVAIPNVVGQSERSAAVNVRRLSLDFGTVAHLAAPGEPGIVLAQTPNANAVGVDRPRVSVLLSAAEDPKNEGFVMPSLVGLTLGGAAARAAAVGLHVASAEEVAAPAAVPGTLAGPAPAPGVPGASGTTAGLVVAQTPLAGHRVSLGDPVRISLGN
jgi:eukaryotic-like serine/threonine-protein kinase